MYTPLVAAVLAVANDLWSHARLPKLGVGLAVTVFTATAQNGIVNIAVADEASRKVALNAAIASGLIVPTTHSCTLASEANRNAPIDTAGADAACRTSFVCPLAAGVLAAFAPIDTTGCSDCVVGSIAAAACRTSFCPLAAGVFAAFGLAMDLWSHERLPNLGLGIDIIPVTVPPVTAKNGKVNIAVADEARRNVALTVNAASASGLIFPATHSCELASEANSKAPIDTAVAAAACRTSFCPRAAGVFIAFVLARNLIVLAKVTFACVKCVNLAVKIIYFELLGGMDLHVICSRGAAVIVHARTLLLSQENRCRLTHGVSRLDLAPRIAFSRCLEHLRARTTQKRIAFSAGGLGMGLLGGLFVCSRVLRNTWLIFGAKDRGTCHAAAEGCGWAIIRLLALELNTVPAAKDAKSWLNPRDAIPPDCQGVLLRLDLRDVILKRNLGYTTVYTTNVDQEDERAQDEDSEHGA